MIKRCARCNAENDFTELFCVKCGSLFIDESESLAERVKKWNTGTLSRSRESVVICPDCGGTNEAPEGIVPIECKICGYYFQAGIDRPVSRTDLQSRKPYQKSSDTEHDEKESLRLVLTGRSAFPPAVIDEDGAVIGGKNSVLPIHTECQVKIWKTPAGWYFRPLCGLPLLNGENAEQAALYDGDELTLDNEVIRIEIV